MPDRILTITLDDALLSRIAEKARALGLSSEAFASLVIQQALAEPDGLPSGFGEPASTASTYDADEPVYELEDVLTAFSAELERRLALKA